MQHDIFLKKNDVLKWVLKNKVKPSFNRKRKIRFVDLFSGCGGLSYGITSAANELGFNAASALAVDSHPVPLKIYENNIPHDKGAIFNASVLDFFNLKNEENFTTEELSFKEKIGAIDILVAGPPCQGHSDLNNSTRRNDPRNSLYMACIRAVSLLEPHLVIIENVPTVIHSSESVVQNTKLGLRSRGYYVKDLNINFLDLGLPQTRKRHVLVASKDEIFINSLAVLHARQQIATLREFFVKIEKTTDDILIKSGKLSAENMKRVDYLFDNDLYDLPDEFRPDCHKNKSHSYKSVYGRLNLDLPAQTITSGYGSIGQGRYIHPMERRTLHSREALRIQGFPDRFDFTKTTNVTELRRMVANAVPPQLSYLLTKLYIQQVLSKPFFGSGRSPKQIDRDSLAESSCV